MTSYGQSLLRKYIERSLRRPTEIIENYRPDWLGGLELDFYLPEIRVAFEFNGDQHYAPIHGTSALARQVRNDKSKRAVCRELGVVLISVVAADLCGARIIKRIPAFAGVYLRKGREVRRFFIKPKDRAFKDLDVESARYLAALKNGLGSVTTEKRPHGHYTKMAEMNLGWNLERRDRRSSGS